jgi:DNA-binding MarR family transcriptional regulator
MKYDGKLVVWERVVAHLGPYSTERMDAMIGLKQVTQDGIGEALGISRAHVALMLKKLIAEGRVEERLQHVNGSCSRRKTYYLTENGREVYRELGSMVDVPLGALVFAPANKTAKTRDPLKEIDRMRVRLDAMEAKIKAQQKAAEISKGA